MLWVLSAMFVPMFILFGLLVMDINFFLATRGYLVNFLLLFILFLGMNFYHDWSGLLKMPSIDLMHALAFGSSLSLVVIYTAHFIHTKILCHVQVLAFAALKLPLQALLLYFSNKLLEYMFFLGMDT